MPHDMLSTYTREDDVQPPISNEARNAAWQQIQHIEADIKAAPPRS